MARLRGGQAADAGLGERQGEQRGALKLHVGILPGLGERDLDAPPGLGQRDRLKALE